MSRAILHGLVALMGLYLLLVAWWQARVLGGEAMGNPDGSVDDWHR